MAWEEWEVVLPLLQEQEAQEEMEAQELVATAARAET